MKESHVLRIKNKSEILYLRLDEILYIQADGNYSNIYFADGSVLRALTYQRAEIIRMIEQQSPDILKSSFVLLGRSFLINIRYILRIQPGKQLLTFRMNQFGSCKKISIKATAKALSTLITNLERRA